MKLTRRGRWEADSYICTWYGYRSIHRAGTTPEFPASLLEPDNLDRCGRHATNKNGESDEEKGKGEQPGVKGWLTSIVGMVAEMVVTR